MLFRCASLSSTTSRFFGTVLMKEAIRARDEALTTREIADLAQRFDGATQAIVAARAALRP